jgi:DNA-binding CsgD family transcriptional regulator
MNFDPILLLERNYEPQPDARAWLRSMVPHVSSAMEPDGLAGLGYFLGERGAVDLEIDASKPGTDVAEARQVLQKGFELATPAELRAVTQAARKPGISSLFEVLGDIPANRWAGTPIRVGDSVALLVPATETPPAIFATNTASVRTVTSLERAVWYRIAIHLSAAYRLAGRAPSTDADDVEAVVTAGGKLVDLRGLGHRPNVRAVLRDAVLAIDRARTRRGRADPLAALELWQALLAGRWSLVEHFDSDGRRFLLARRNDPAVSRPPGVTPRQRQVLFYASLGLSNQEIGYALGLAENTVSTHVASGLTRLGLPNRGELIRVATELALAALPRG